MMAFSNGRFFFKLPVDERPIVRVEDELDVPVEFPGRFQQEMLDAPTTEREETVLGAKHAPFDDLVGHAVPGGETGFFERI